MPCSELPSASSPAGGRGLSWAWSKGSALTGFFNQPRDASAGGSLGQQAIRFFLDRRVTLASACFQLGTIEHGNLAAAVSSIRLTFEQIQVLLLCHLRSPMCLILIDRFRAAFRPPASRGEGAEGTECVRSMRTPAQARVGALGRAA